MGCKPTKENMNIYFRCRKEAALFNDKLYSRDGASELLGISVSTLSDYELGLTKIIPPDMVVKMAELYNAPQLCTGYCKTECPIGERLNISSEFHPLERVALKLIKLLDGENIEQIKRQIADISEDGVIDDNEQGTLEDIEKYLANLSTVISSLSLICKKARKGD